MTYINSALGSGKLITSSSERDGYLACVSHVILAQYEMYVEWVEDKPNGREGSRKEGCNERKQRIAETKGFLHLTCNKETCIITHGIV